MNKIIVYEYNSPQLLLINLLTAGNSIQQNNIEKLTADQQSWIFPSN